MNTVISIVTLRALGLLALVGGQGRASASFYAMADLLEAGKLTDDQLVLVAEKLKLRSIEDADWTDVHERIARDRDILHAPPKQDGRARVGLLGALAVVAGLLLAAPAIAAEPAPRQATLSWLAPTTYSDGSSISFADRQLLRFNVYRGAAGSQLSAKVKIAEGVSGLQYVDGNRPLGVTDCYQVTAFFVGEPETEGAPSSEGCKSYPRPKAGQTQGLTVD